MAFRLRRAGEIHKNTIMTKLGRGTSNLTTETTDETSDPATDHISLDTLPGGREAEAKATVATMNPLNPTQRPDSASEPTSTKVI